MKVKKLTAGACVFALALGSTAPAFAHDCAVAKKPPTAGSVAVVNIENGEFTPLKKNPFGAKDNAHGGFITLTDGTQSVSTFMHAPQGVLPPSREGGSQYNCDGKGLDSLSVCFGGE
jgi:hypothetical protein